MFDRLGQFISKNWLLVIIVWLIVVVGVRRTAPRWDDVTYDGDLAYMPAYMSSVKGERLLDDAFPNGRSKSEIVVVFARQDGPLETEDLEVADSFAGRLQNLVGVAALQKARTLTETEKQLRSDGDTENADRTLAEIESLREKAEEAWDEALTTDETFADAIHNRSLLYRDTERPDEYQQEQDFALELKPELAELDNQLVPEVATEFPIIGVWTRHNRVVGSKMRSEDKQALLVVMRLSEEFMSTVNVPVLRHVESLLEEQNDSDFPIPEGLEVGISGSAAVGADMLTSAADSISNTELYTVILVVLILAIVYRSPLLVAVPLATIIVSLAVAMGLVAAMTQLQILPGMEWWDFKIFTTTKIFVVVILFGAGTDFCLFLISRYKEFLDAGEPKEEAIAKALAGVGEALAASALTTIVGLGTMFFAQFGKFRNSGPAIGLCLFVTLLACLTFAPAMLRGLGNAVFWPWGVTSSKKKQGAEKTTPQTSLLDRMWEGLSRLILAYPGRVLILSTLAMLYFAISGLSVDVTYDLLSELDESKSSKRGAEIMRRHYPVGETGPIVVLAHKKNADFDSTEAKDAITQLTADLYVDESIEAVRSLREPLGDKPSRISLTEAKKMAIISHPLTRSIFLSKRPELNGDVARFELVLGHDPFSIDATNTLDKVDEYLQKLKDGDGYWKGANFVFAGTTAGIRDLRQVTRSDNLQIQILVVLAVLGILLIILRRPIVCLYLIFSVLFSYFVTIGATEMFFQYAYGDSFHGLDWKVPLFLFVILVAIGQDYNIYLTTRVFEEQEHHGMFGGLRRAIVRTGGIITSCGVIMAGTFISMTTGSLRGIVELGFALSLGVILDTFVVRPILVPAFLALLFRFKAARDQSHSVRELRKPFSQQQKTTNRPTLTGSRV